MATALLSYLTCETLPCACNYPADVILCVNPDKLAANDVVSPTWEYKTIDATLVGVTKGCNGSPSKYEFSYDDDQIADGETLYATDVTGIVCKGCIADWVRDEIKRLTS